MPDQAIAHRFFNKLKAVTNRGRSPSFIQSQAKLGAPAETQFSHSTTSQWQEDEQKDPSSEPSQFGSFNIVQPLANKPRKEELLSRLE